MGDSNAKLTEGFEFLKQNCTMPVSFVTTAPADTPAEKRRPVVLHPFLMPVLAPSRKKLGSKKERQPKPMEKDERPFAVPYSYPSMAIRFPLMKKSLLSNMLNESYICIFHSAHERPLDIWDKQIRGGAITRVPDSEQNFPVLEITGKSPLTFIIAPICPTHRLGIRLPFIVLDVKNLEMFFEFQVEILDYSRVRRVFKFTTTAIGSKVTPSSCTIPCKLVKGWNQVIFNLDQMTRAVFKSTYKETVRVQVHANCRLRRVYFCARPGRDYRLDRHQNVEEVDDVLTLAASHSAIDFSGDAAIAAGDMADIQRAISVISEQTSAQLAQLVPEFSEVQIPTIAMNQTTESKTNEGDRMLI